MSPTVALVTVTYNSAEDIQRHWSSASDLEASWIVADNCSSDNSVALAVRFGAQLVRMRENRGFSAANNAAAAISDSDCLIFVNPDVTVTAEGIDSADLAEMLTESGCTYGQGYHLGRPQAVPVPA